MKKTLHGNDQCALYKTLHAWTNIYIYFVFKMWTSAPTTMEAVNTCAAIPLAVSFVTVEQATSSTGMG